MAVKAIVDVEVNDSAFKTFHALFTKYKEQAAEMPGVWGEVGKETTGIAGNFGDMVAAMMAQAALAETLEARRKKALADSEKQKTNWKQVAVSTKDAAVNIGKATLSLAKWAAATGIVSGLLGAGGLYGIDRLAIGVSSGRRSALGLGTSYGEQKAFETDFGRFVDPTSLLGGVSEALHDVTKRWALSSAGASPAAIASGDAVKVAASLVGSVKALVDRTPANQLQQLSDSRGLGIAGFTLQDLIRLKGSPADDVAAQQRALGTDASAFGLSEATQLKWQNFSTQLSRAGKTIEKVFVDGLTPLTGPLSKLSDSIASALGTFLSSIKPSDIKAIGVDIEDLGKFLASPEFRTDIKDFAADVGTLAKTIADALHKLGSHSVKDAAFGASAGALIGALGGPGGAVGGAIVGGAVGAGVGELRDSFESGKVQVYDHNTILGRAIDKLKSYSDYRASLPKPTNPGNIRDPLTGAFRSFNSADEGVSAVAKQLLRYEYATKGGLHGKGWGGLDTIAKIVATYAPKEDGNDVAAYIKDVSQRTGFGADQHLDLSDQTQLAKLTSAILRHENKRNASYTPGAVVTILNQTGGSAVVQTAQAASQ